MHLPGYGDKKDSTLNTSTYCIRTVVCVRKNTLLWVGCRTYHFEVFVTMFSAVESLLQTCMGLVIQYKWTELYIIHIYTIYSYEVDKPACRKGEPSGQVTLKNLWPYVSVP